MTRAALVVASLVVVEGAAAAQSTRYPPPPVDLDAEREAESDFWQNAIEPGRDRYDELVERAARLLGRRSDDARAVAIELLVEASALLPGRVDGWAWLGLAREQEEDFAGCRDALERAWAIDPGWEESPRPVARALGVCRARAGDLDGAIEVLEALVARGDDAVETLWRLGEVYMAMGRLDDARGVLDAAIAQSPASPHYVHAAWTLAVAADRAREPDATQDAAEIARRHDDKAIVVEHPPGGYLVPADRDYYVALASDATGQPERALVRYRRYLAAFEKVDHAPWIARAREHERALRGFRTSSRTRIEGTDPLDRKKVEAAVARIDGDLRACLKKTPRLLVHVEVTVHGPAAKAPPPLAPASSGKPPQKGAKQRKPARPTAPLAPFGRPAIRPAVPAPPAGTSVSVRETHDHPDADVRAAVACVEREAAGLSLPTPVAGTWAMVIVPVVWR